MPGMTYHAINHSSDIGALFYGLCMLAAIPLGVGIGLIISPDMDSHVRKRDCIAGSLFILLGAGIIVWACAVLI